MLYLNFVIHPLFFEELHERVPLPEFPQIQSSPLGWRPGGRGDLPPAFLQQVKKQMFSRSCWFYTSEADAKPRLCPVAVAAVTGLYWFVQEPPTGAAGEGSASSSAAPPSVRQAPSPVLLSWLRLGGLR